MLAWESGLLVFVCFFLICLSASSSGVCVIVSGLYVQRSVRVCYIIIFTRSCVVVLGFQSAAVLAGGKYFV